MSMPRWKYRLCKFLCKFDRIPRYGRLYTLKSFEVDSPNRDYDMRWEWYRPGLWGFNLIDSRGWLMDFIFEDNPDIFRRRHKERFYVINATYAWRQQLKHRRRLGLHRGGSNAVRIRALVRR